MELEKKRHRARVWYKKNAEKVRQDSKAYREKQKLLNPPTPRKVRTPEEKIIWLILQSAKRRAKMKGLPFSLEPSDIFIPSICPVLGIPLFFTKGGKADNTPSIDRIIPEFGYVKENVVMISWRANKIKNVASVEELEKITEFYKAITKH